MSLSNFEHDNDFFFFPVTFSGNKVSIRSKLLMHHLKKNFLIFILILDNDQRTPSSSVLSVLSPFGCFFPS